MLRSVFTVCGVVTLLGAGLSQSALAETPAAAAGGPAATGPAEAAVGTSDATDGTTGGDALAEVTVTAEKQTQNLQKTAAAVTAISAQALLDAGVTDLREAQKLVPSVRFQAEGNNTQRSEEHTSELQSLC